MRETSVRLCTGLKIFFRNLCFVLCSFWLYSAFRSLLIGTIFEPTRNRLASQKTNSSTNRGTSEASETSVREFLARRIQWCAEAQFCWGIFHLCFNINLAKHENGTWVPAPMTMGAPWQEFFMCGLGSVVCSPLGSLANWFVCVPTERVEFDRAQCCNVLSKTDKKPQDNLQSTRMTTPKKKNIEPFCGNTRDNDRVFFEFQDTSHCVLHADWSQQRPKKLLDHKFAQRSLWEFQFLLIGDYLV